MERIVLIPNPGKDCDLAVTRRVSDKLSELGNRVFIDFAFGENVPSAVPYTEFPNDAELIIVIGGDGSILDASVGAVERDIAVLGVNLGKVGYLSEVEPDNLDLLSKLADDDYYVNEMMLLEVKCGDDVSKRLAVNDIIISHNDFLGIAEFTLQNAKNETVKYRADGMILSTPQGSTAYSLSAGGPVVSHSIDSIVATPICPHSFFNRSIIFSPDEALTLENSGKSPLNVSVDGRFFADLAPTEKCVIKRSDKKLKMLTFSDDNMFSTLFKKMRILEDI